MKQYIEQRLKECLQRPYENSQRFLEDVIFLVFGEDNFESAGNLNVLRKRPELKPKADASGITSIHKVGDLLIDGAELGIFDVTLDYKKQLQRNRVEVQQIIRSIISTHSGAFIIFHYESGARWEWRFTFCHKGASNIDSTDAKRYTFLLGPGQSCRTAAENFAKIHNKIDKEGEFEMDDIIRAFDVEALSKEFFAKYKVRYGRFVGHVIGKEYVDKGEGKGEWKEKEWLSPSHLFYTLGKDEKVVRDYIKKLLGRIVFLHFLQKKGWLGATDEDWTNGPQDFMRKLFEQATDEQKDNFLDGILEPLFVCLDTPFNRRQEFFDTTVEGLRNVRIPFLGGLFESNEEDKAESIFPSELFADLFKFLGEYNFTIDENDPNDAQVGVDPEMLGRIFENLLEDNKDKGAFYTPKEIVQYMCRESLIAYLQTKANDETENESIRQFVTTHDVSTLGGKESDLAMSISQSLKDVKICDPAIGSGAFPMGLLNELFLCRGFIEDFSNAAEIKKHIIQQNIYGVDIEKGAVDIARLRFWLSLITDAERPNVLPNMDYKIMQGNSLLEQYNIDDNQILTLDDIVEGSKKNVTTANNRSPLFKGQDVLSDLSKKLNEYYSITDDVDKQRARENIDESVREFIRIKIGRTYHKTSQVLDRVQALDKLANTKLINQDFFLWHTWFHDVFEKGGFDIVIGNPPYISAPAQIANDVLATQRNNIIKSKKFRSLYQKWDLYIPFIEFGIRLAAKGGIVTMIVPYPLTNQTYGKILREMIAYEYDLFELCDLNGTKIFENATVSNCIPFIRKAKPSSSTTAISHIDEHKVICRVFNKSVDDLMPDKKTSVWNVGEEKRDAKRHQGMHILGDYCYVSKGMVLYSEEGLFTNKDLVSDYYDDIHCRKYIEAKDIERYQIQRTRYLEYDTDRVPDKVSRPTFRELYDIPKLITNCLGDLKVTIDMEDRYICQQGLRLAVLWNDIKEVENKSITSSIKKYSRMARKDMESLSASIDLRYILGIMASKYGSELLTLQRAGDYHIVPEHIRNIPIAPATQEQQQPVITLVDQILSAKKSNPQADTSALEARIDRLVYDLYGLNEGEIKIVEGTNQ